MRYLMISLMVLIAVVGVCAQSQKDPVTERLEKGLVDWTNGVIYADGYALYPQRGTPAQRRLLAKRGALMDAQRNLAEIVHGVRVTGESLMRDFEVASETVRTQVDAVIKGFRIVHQEAQEDGYFVRIAIPIFGENSLAKVVMPHLPSLLPKVEKAPSLKVSPPPETIQPPTPTITLPKPTPSAPQPKLTTPTAPQRPSVTAPLPTSSPKVTPVPAQPTKPASQSKPVTVPLQSEQRKPEAKPKQETAPTKQKSLEQKQTERKKPEEATKPLQEPKKEQRETKPELPQPSEPKPVESKEPIKLQPEPKPLPAPEPVKVTGETRPVPAMPTLPAPEAPPAQLPAVRPLAPSSQPSLPPLSVPHLPEGPYTGLIVDCRGLGVKPAMSPKILDEEGKEVYGTVDVSREEVLERGIVDYAKASYDLLKLRCGNRPLVIRAIGKAGAHSGYVIISNEDAQRIQEANKQWKFLEKLAVVFVLD